MKKRLLPFFFFALFVGFSFIPATFTFAGNPVGKGKEITRIDPKSSPVSNLNLNWQELGPINASGRTRALIYDTKDQTGQTLYAGGVAGGIWKSTNLGLTWHQVNTNSNEVLKVTALAQAPSGTIYAGTGEMACFNGSFVGSGLYRSDDGENFTPVANTQPEAGQSVSEWAYIMDIAVSSTGRVYVATSTGLKYSDDGSTWVNALSGIAINVEVGPDNTVLAAVDIKVYISPSGDQGTYTELTTGTPTTLPNQYVGYTQLAISKSDPNVMYVSFAMSTGSFLGVYASYDHGTTWAVVFPGNPTINPLGSTGCSAMALQVFPNDPNKVLFGGQNLYVGTKIGSGYYDWQQISSGYGYVQNIPGPVTDFVPYFHHQYIFNPTNPLQFAIATNDGVSIGTINSSGFSFRHAIKGLATSQFVSVATSISQNAVIGGAEYLGIMLMPGNMFTLDPKTGVQILPGVTGEVAWSIIMPREIFFTTSSSEDPIARSEDMGATIALSFNDSVNNTTKYTAMAMWESFDFVNTKDSAKYKAPKYIPADSTIIIKSNTGGFPIHYTTPTEIAMGDSILIPDPIANRFFLAGSGPIASTTSPVGFGIWMTKDALTFSKNPRWYKIASYDEKIDTVVKITVSKDLSTVWAGTSKGRLIRLTNVDQAYNYQTADVRDTNCVVVTTIFDSIPEFNGRKISSISISDDKNSLLVSFDQYGTNSNLYLVTNTTGDNIVITSVKGNMPQMPVYTSLFEMHDQNRVLIGTDLGVFSTTNIHASQVEWSPETTGAGNVPVAMIKQQSNPGIYYQRPQNYGNLYIATLGRGIFYDSTYSVPLAVNEINNVAGKATIGVTPNPFRDNVTVTYKLEKASNVVLTVYDINGRVAASLALGTREKGEQKSTVNLRSLSAGSYVFVLNTSSGTAAAKAVKVE